MEVIMSDLDEKRKAYFQGQNVDSVQAEVQSVLFECPKCDSKQTKIIGKKSYFGAIGKILLGLIPTFFAPVIIFIKVIGYLVTLKYKKIRKMVVLELWDKYVLGLKCWLIILTFGIANITKVYTCEKCGKKWFV
jgi:predicted RNA-binding Zn-ribbon protein involved in translation (DUF1610 family)